MSTPERKTTPPLTTPMCDLARTLPTLTQRMRHYRICEDERCRKRAAGWANIAKGITVKS